MNPSKALQLLPQAYALHQSGRLREAEPVYRKALGAASRDPVALYMFGLLNLQLGKGEEAVRWNNASLKINPAQPEAQNNKGLALQYLGRNEEALACYDLAVKLNPSYAGAWYNRGNALQDLKRYEEAEGSYRQALKLRPDHAGTWVNLGKAYKLQENYGDARACYEKALSLAPDNAAAYNNLGNVLLELEDYEAALMNFNRAIQLDPGYADAYLNASLALQEMERYEEAVTVARKGIELKPDYAEAYRSQGFALLRLGKYDDALDSYRQALSLKPDYAEAHFGLATALQELKRYDEALVSFDSAISLKPDSAEYHTNKGTMLIELGRMGEAAEVLNKAVEINPGAFGALGELLSLKRFSDDDPHFRQLEAQYAQRDSLPPSKRIRLDFAIGKALEKLGHYDEAFAAYQEANQLHSQSHPYDEARDSQLLANSCSFFTRELFEKCAEAARQLPEVSDGRTPIFIVGMPRSGTTLLEQILASHPSLYGAGELGVLSELARKVELPAINALDWETPMLEMRKLGQEYLDTVWEMAPKAHYITDKMPHNFWHVGVLHLMLPNAKIIHAMRDPLDVCFSCYALNFKEGHHYCYDLKTLGRHFNYYKQMMAHWHRVLPPGRILDVRYEDTVSDLESQARRVLEYIGLPWDPACLKFHEHDRAVKTASVTQVRQPIYKTSVARWKHFESHLGPLIETIQASV